MCWLYDSGCLSTADRVAQTLESLSQRVAERVFCRFPALAERVLEISQEILIREKEATREILQHDVDAEMGYLFTNDERSAFHRHFCCSCSFAACCRCASFVMLLSRFVAAAACFLCRCVFLLVLTLLLLPVAAVYFRYLQDHGTMITQQQLTLEQLQQQQQLLQQHQQMGIGPDGRPLQQPSHAERAQQMLQQVQSQMSTLWTSKDKKKPVYSGSP